ncbi:HEAT repeat domain-containing protein [Streptomyces sp. NPDC006235]|uniref:HEAT repeat domain-containing protein n=1 Tax=Streptomyces sp. NPDC006235 TaxID=3156736 RepID=UPI0033BC3B6E
MGWQSKRVEAGGERAVGAGGDIKAAATGDYGVAVHIENQYVQQTVETVPSPEETDEALRRYATRIRETYGRLDLEVLIPTEEGEHPPVGLDEVFVAPTVRADPPPVELPRDIRQRLVDSGEWPSSLPPGLEREALDRARQAYAERPARDVLEVLAGPHEDRLVLLGDPGAGKSTLARHLALTLTGAVRPDDPLAALDGRVPLVVELREYAAGEWRERTFEDFLEHLHTTKGMAPPYPVTERILAEGRAVVVFDGLDELFEPAAREQVGHRIADFAGRHQQAGVRVVVTSRVIGYRRGVLERAGFAHYMVQDLSRQQIELFARQWYATAYPHDEERAARLCRRLTEAVGHSRPVGELAGNPLLLTILAIIGRRRELPRDRQGVYRHAVAVLVAHWDEHAKHLRGPTDLEALSYLGDEDRHELLRLVARRMQDGEGGIAGNHIHQDELLATFKEYLSEQYELPVAQAVSAARTMVRQFRERNFILSHYGGGVYGFVHRAFLEYLAAVDIDQRYTREREWTREEFVEEVFARHAEDPAWHEVLLLLVGQIGEREAGAVIDRLLEMHRRRVDPDWDSSLLTLSVRALAEVRRIGVLAGQSRAVVDALVAIVEQTDSTFSLIGGTEETVAALKTFPPHWSGRPRFLRWFHLRGQFRSHSLPGQYASVLYQDSAIPRIMAGWALDSPVQAALFEELAERWGAERDVRELLRTRAVADPSEHVRSTALEALAELGTDEEGVSDLLADRSVADPSPRIRALALSLRGDSASDEDLWAPLAALAVSAEDKYQRYQALSALAQYRGDDPEVRELLCRRAVEDPAGFVRLEALTHLGDVLDDERIAALMRKLALEDPNANTRHLALYHLTRHSEDPEASHRLAVEDPDWFVRSQALFGLRNIRGDDPATWELARRRAVADPDERVRGSACSMLWQTAGSQPGTVEFLRERAVADPGPQARAGALYGLVQLSADEPATWELVRAYAVGDTGGVVRVAALKHLCGHRGDDAGTWELALDRLGNDPEAEVREEALRSLRHYRGDEAAKWAAIRARAQDDDSAPVRKLALALLATGRGDDAAAREVFRDRAVADADPGIRDDALRWYAVCETDAAAADFLRHRAVADPDPQPRIAALQSLAFGWPAHPETLPLLRNRAESDEEKEVRDASARALAAAESLRPVSDRLP